MWVEMDGALLRSRFLMPIARVGILAFLCLLASSSWAQTGANVLVVVNDASPDSVRIGEAYAAARSVPATQVVRLKAPTTESVERLEYQRSIEGPVSAWIRRHNLHDQVLFIVLTKGVPIRVAGTAGMDGTGASVDSELTLLYRKLVGVDDGARGRTANPYFLGSRPIADARRFTRIASDIYLVTRLDGFTAEDAIGLIERGGSARRDGQIVLDQRDALMDRGGDSWLAEAASRVNELSSGRAAIENTKALASVGGPVLGYYSWGSNDPANKLRRFGLQFTPGAIGGLFVSTDGRTFSEPPADWAPGPSARRGGYFGSGSQSLAADLVRDGITGVSAHVDEPFLDATIRPQILFPAYLSGFTLAESFYLAMPYLSWQTMVLGDPLAAPFASRSLTDSEIHGGISAATALPALFSSRRLEQLSKTGLNRTALEFWLRAGALVDQDRTDEVEQALLGAVKADPRLTLAQIQLATLYETAGAHDKARARYEQILAVEPNNAIILNNLAYSLAVHAGERERALDLAERAFRLAKAPAIADTLGWIHHLRGDDRAASPLLESAAAALPGNVDILVHAAVVRAALGDATRALAAVNAARKLDPRLDDRADIKTLLAKLPQ
jgi:uncharacterized protein (TIGR03790 family)